MSATAFYDLTEAIKDELAADDFVNTVTYGDIFKVALNKSTMYPLAHLNVDSVTYNNQVLTFSISLICMDILDQNKAAVSDIFVGNDNEHDVLNTQLAVINRLLEVLRRGDLYKDSKYQLVGNPTLESFTDRFEDDVAGWSVTFDVQLRNTMTKCDLT
jgi:hypothetical protein